MHRWGRTHKFPFSYCLIILQHFKLHLNVKRMFLKLRNYGAHHLCNSISSCNVVLHIVLSLPHTSIYHLNSIMKMYPNVNIKFTKWLNYWESNPTVEHQVLFVIFWNFCRWLDSFHKRDAAVPWKLLKFISYFERV